MTPRTMRPKRASRSIQCLPTATLAVYPVRGMAPDAATRGERGLERDIVGTPLRDAGGRGDRVQRGHRDLGRDRLMGEEARLPPSVELDGEREPQAAQQIGAHDVTEP